RARALRLHRARLHRTGRGGLRPWALQRRAARAPGGCARGRDLGAGRRGGVRREARRAAGAGGVSAWRDPLWEVFVRPRRGLSHVHVGSLHAADAALALQHARDLYTRRQEGVSLWVVPASALVASDPGDRESLFDPAADKEYRHPTHYTVG